MCWGSHPPPCLVLRTTEKLFLCILDPGSKKEEHPRAGKLCTTWLFLKHSGQSSIRSIGKGLSRRWLMEQRVGREWEGVLLCTSTKFPRAEQVSWASTWHEHGRMPLALSQLKNVQIVEQWLNPSLPFLVPYLCGSAWAKALFQGALRSRKGHLRSEVTGSSKVSTVVLTGNISPIVPMMIFRPRETK